MNQETKKEMPSIFENEPEDDFEEYLRIWGNYLSEKNDRSHIGAEDDRWGINTAVIGQALDFRSGLVNSQDPVIQLFRENLTQLFLAKDLCLKFEHALKMYGAAYQLKSENDLSQFGVVNELGMAVDLTILYTVQRNDLHFDYFFALKMSQLDIMELDVFLDYQLQESFQGNASEFCKFLSLFQVKYISLERAIQSGIPKLSDEIKRILQEKINDMNELAEKEKEQSKIDDKNKKNILSEEAPMDEEKFRTPEFTYRQWGILIDTAIEAMTGESKTVGMNQMAKLVNAILGKKTATVNNSEAYKKLKEINSNEKPEQTFEDLELMKKYFQKIGWKEAVKKIEEQIAGLQKLIDKHKKR